MSELYEFHLEFEPEKDGLMEDLFNLYPSLDKVFDSDGGCSHETDLVILQFITKFSELHPEVLFKLYSREWGGGNEPELQYIKGGMEYLVWSEFPAFNPELLNWPDRPKIEVHTHFQGEQKLPIINIVTPDEWETDKGTRCVVHFNGKEIYQGVL